MSDTIEAWYFSAEDKRLRYGDNREIAIGVTHCVQPPLRLCQHGLHASVKAIDALSYATSPVVWRVKLSGEIERGNDKLCATRREYVAGGIDASDTLLKFARLCALEVAHLWDIPVVVKQYLETGNKALRATAGTAALAAARSAAWDAARAAAWAAARDAALDAAGAVARDALDAARAAQNARLEAMLIEAMSAGDK